MDINVGDTIYLIWKDNRKTPTIRESTVTGVYMNKKGYKVWFDNNKTCKTIYRSNKRVPNKTMFTNLHDAVIELEKHLNLSLTT